MLLKVAPSIGVSTPPSSAVRDNPPQLQVGYLRPFGEAHRSVRIVCDCSARKTGQNAPEYSPTIIQRSLNQRAPSEWERKHWLDRLHLAGDNNRRASAQTAQVGNGSRLRLRGTVSQPALKYA